METGMINSLEELCITRVATVNPFASVQHPEDVRNSGPWVRIDIQKNNNRKRDR